MDSEFTKNCILYNNEKDKFQQLQYTQFHTLVLDEADDYKLSTQSDALHIQHKRVDHPYIVQRVEHISDVQR